MNSHMSLRFRGGLQGDAGEIYRDEVQPHQREHCGGRAPEAAQDQAIGEGHWQDREQVFEQQSETPQRHPQRRQVPAAPHQQHAERRDHEDERI
jgi:hypothetical protein